MNETPAAEAARRNGAASATARLRRMSLAVLACLALLVLPAVLLARGAAPPFVAELARSRLLATIAASLLLLAGPLAGTLLAARTRASATPRRTRLKQAAAVAPPCLAAIALVLLAATPPAPPLANPPALAAAACAALAAFLLLILERHLAAIPAPHLPEAPSLRRLAFTATVACFAAALIETAAATALPHAAALTPIPPLLPTLIAAELAARALLGLYLPPEPAPDTRAAANSTLARLLAIALRAEPAAPLVRDRLGLDFSRSWALAWLRASALPLATVLALFAWSLSGVVLVPVDGRAVVERFGAPVRVLHPGLHATLPWPLGVVRRVEFGTIHELALGDTTAPTQAAAPPQPLLAAPLLGPAAYGFAAPPAPPAPPHPGIAPRFAALPHPARATAEDPDPIEADRLWDAPHPGELTLLVASDATTTGGTVERRQLFQSVSADLRVIWRVGLSDRDALAATYAARDPAALLRATAGQVVGRAFAGRTLDAALGADRETMAANLRQRLQVALDRHAAGIEIIAVVVEAIHPPAGAADAYHAVRAAEIAASAAIFAERGRAITILSQSRQYEAEQIARTTAHGAETDEAASANAIRFAADRTAYATGPKSFLLERYLADLTATVAKTPMTIIDSRIWAASPPTLDLRPLPGAAPTTTDGE